MRNSIFVVVVTVMCIVAAGCSESSTSSKSSPAQSEAEKTKQAILRVLRADQHFAKKRESLPPNSTPSQIAWAVGQYCNDLERLDMADCPADFRVAYRHHMGAWREAQAAVQQLPDGFLEGVFMGAMNGLLRGESDGGTSRLEGGLKRALERVGDTWIEVEKIGAKYGAAL